jgi:hypothetical protein
MARLADYLAELAVLFGNKAHVHFMKVRKGSAVQEIMVDTPAEAEVTARLRLATNPDAPEDIARANWKINRMLREDNATGGLKIKGGAKILDFPGRKTPLAEEAVVYEVGELDGVVIKIGGKDETVPALLEGENGVYYRCNTTKDVARMLAGHLFGHPVRVTGRGKWRRTQEGVWELDTFDIKSFEALDETPLGDIVTTLRAVEGSEWNTMEDPQAEFKRLRGE